MGGSPARTRGCSLSLSRLGTTKVSNNLFLLHTNYCNIYLGVETLFGSSGACPVTLTPRVDEGRVQMPFCVLLKVIICLDILDVHSNDVNKEI